MTTPTLTPRQQEVSDLLYQGKCCKEIARALGVSLRTAKWHRTNVLHKYGVKTQVELLAEYVAFLESVPWNQEPKKKAAPTKRQ